MDTPHGSEVLPVWERPEPQPRAAPVPLSRAKIAATAIRLADAHGLDELSVRKIAKELGVGPMRLYDYVDNRSELLDLMVDAVYAQIAEADQQSDWRATVLAIVHRTREAALDHEWFADLLGARPHLGPHALTVGESTAAALSQAPGVRDIDDLQRALGALNAFIVGALRREITERRTARLTGTDVSAWQAALGPYLTRMLETGRYPTVSRLVIDGAHLNAKETFHHNLITILDGITAIRGWPHGDDDDMDPVVKAVLDAIREGKAAEVKLLLHPYLHWTAPGVKLRGRTNVLTYLATATDQGVPDEYELRDGQVYRWTSH